MSKIERVVSHAEQVAVAVDWVSKMVRSALRGGEVLITLSRPARTQEQNRKMWAMLRDVARQVPLVVNGAEVWADPEDWKDVFTAALKQETRMAQGVDGSVVVLGMRTSRMKKAELSELIELIYAHGAEQGVNWSAETDALINQDREAA